MFSTSPPEIGNQTLTTKTFNIPNIVSHRNYDFNGRVSECEIALPPAWTKQVDSIWEQSAGQNIGT